MLNGETEPPPAKLLQQGFIGKRFPYLSAAKEKRLKEKIKIR